jgi:hypothetical protein
MVEPQIVVLVVAGSSPVGHPVFKKVNWCEVKGEKFATNHFSQITNHFPSSACSSTG